MERKFRYLYLHLALAYVAYALSQPALFVFVAVTGSVYLIEFFFFKEKKSTSLYQFFDPSGSFRNDLHMFLINRVFNLSQAMFLLAVFVLEPFKKYLDSVKIFNTVNDNQYLLFAVGVLAHSFLSYAFHVAQHKIPFLWQLHKVHHEAEEMNILTTHREHPFSDFFQNFLFILVFHVLGIGFAGLFSYFLFKNVLVTFAHSKIDVDFRILKYFVITPNYHKRHHSSNSENYNKNFSLDFPFWDIVFKTAHFSYFDGLIGLRRSDHLGIIFSLSYSALSFFKEILNLLLKPKSAYLIWLLLVGSLFASSSIAQVPQIKLTSSTLIVSPQSGGIEYDGSQFTVTTSSLVRSILLSTQNLGTSGTVLTSQGAGQLPVWTTPSGGGGGSANVQTFTVSGTWTKPATGSIAIVECWGGGGSGGRSSGGGGGGGGYNTANISLASLPATVAVTVGLGGAARTTNGNGNIGGNSSFGSYLTAYGGSGGFSGGVHGGNGGGQFSAGPTTWGTGASPALVTGTYSIAYLCGCSTCYDPEDSYAGMGAALHNDYTLASQNGVNHGGGGGAYAFASAPHNAGAASINGGGGGGSRGAAGGVSAAGGAGGAGATTGNGVNGAQPGGGGGGTNTGVSSGAGGNGMCRITVI